MSTNYNDDVKEVNDNDDENKDNNLKDDKDWIECEHNSNVNDFNQTIDGCCCS